MDHEMLSIVQQVLRGLTASFAIAQPDRLPAVAAALRAFPVARGLERQAALMLDDLAAGLEMMESATHRLS